MTKARSASTRREPKGHEKLDQSFLQEICLPAGSEPLRHGHSRPTKGGGTGRGGIFCGCLGLGLPVVETEELCSQRGECFCHFPGEKAGIVGALCLRVSRIPALVVLEARSPDGETAIRRD